MTTKEQHKKKNRNRLLIALVILGPTLAMVLAILSNCENHYQQLPVIAQMPDYEFHTGDGSVVSDETQQGKITIFTTLQSTCPQDCAIDLFRFNHLVYQEMKKYYDSTVQINIVSIVTNELGVPIQSTDELEYTVKDLINEYNPEIWKLVTGSPKQVYNVTNPKTNVNLYTIKEDSAYQNKPYLQTLLLVDHNNQLRFARTGKKEGLIRDFKRHIPLLLKEYYDEVKNKKEDSAS